MYVLANSSNCISICFFQYKGYQIKNTKGEYLKFRLCDCMGVETCHRGLQQEDFENIVDGKVADGEKVRCSMHILFDRTTLQAFLW